MATIEANGITMNYEVQGAGEPLLLIPYLAADQACYAFQVAEYAKHFRCISVDLRGAGLTDKPEGDYTTELFADDVAAFMDAIGVERAHVSGLSLGAATGMWLAAKCSSCPRVTTARTTAHALGDQRSRPSCCRTLPRIPGSTTTISRSGTLRIVRSSPYASNRMRVTTVQPWC
jgi:hypothetical protein